MPKRLARRAAFVLLFGGSLVLAACIDLFHSTEFAGLCDHAPDAAPCSDGAAPTDASPAAEAADAPVDFCTWTADEVTAHVAKACLLVSACEGPVGGNAAGECLVRARLAYDCAANPGLGVRGRLRETWQCLAAADTCAAVEACFGGTVACGGGGTFTVCDGKGETRLLCAAAGAPARYESCVTRGLTCVPNATPARCATGVSPPCERTCTGTALHDCTPPEPDAALSSVPDYGMDCANFGAGGCAKARTDAGDLPYCAPKDGSWDAGACAGRPTMRCEGETAIGCFGAVETRIDCAALSSVCNADAGGAPWDPTRPCRVVGDAACVQDECSSDGAILQACVRGRVIPLACASANLGACATRNIGALQPDPSGHSTGVACARP